MGKCRLFCHPVGGNRRQLRRNGRADVGTQNQSHCRIQIHQTACPQSNDDARTGGTALNDQRGNDSDSDRSQQSHRRNHAIDRRTVEGLKRRQKRRQFGQ